MRTCFHACFTKGVKTMFTGLSAFPLTPLAHDAVDETAFVHLIERLAGAEVDSITALGSTGSYAYLSSEERSRVGRLAVEHPVFIGIGALRTSHILENVKNAEKAGASGLLLAPMTYQPLTDDDVFELFRTITANTSLPVIVYDNPGTTHFTFTTESYGRIAELPGIASIKIPGVPTDQQHAQARIREIRAAVPDHVTIGVSGDANAAAGLAAGCDAWYSVIGGTVPAPALADHPGCLGRADLRRNGRVRTACTIVAADCRAWREHPGCCRHSRTPGIRPQSRSAVAHPRTEREPACPRGRGRTRTRPQPVALTPGFHT